MYIVILIKHIQMQLINPKRKFQMNLTKISIELDEYSKNYQYSFNIAKGKQ